MRRTRAREISWASLVLIIGACTVASGPSYAKGNPSPGEPDLVPSAGLADSAPPGKGIGKGKAKGIVEGKAKAKGIVEGKAKAWGIGKVIPKGKGVAVAGVSYHCLGEAKQKHKQGSPYSYLADSIVMDAGGQSATLEGAATSDLVYDDGNMVPTHMAAASINTSGLMLRTFDTCGTSAGSILNAVVTGEDQTNSSTSGTTYVEFRFNYHAKLGGSGDNFTAFTEATLHVPGFQEESFKVSADGKLIDAPPGMSITDLSVGKDYLYEIQGMYTVEGQLNYGPNVKNKVHTMFEANGKVTGISGSKMVAGFASTEALNTLTYEIVSLDPNVSFSFVPP
jgi:hypothetical protein